MAIALNKARAFVRENVLHIAATESFDDEKVDRAILSAANHFLRNTDAESSTTDISLPNGSSDVDVTASVTGFDETDFYWAEINGYPVRKVPYRSNARQFIGRTPKGRPTRIGFRDDGFAKFDKQADQDYTLKLTHTVKAIDFTPGTASNPNLTLPDQYQWDVLYGAAGYLIWGAPGHPDAEPKLTYFAEAVKQARGEFPEDTTGVQDAQTSA